jgi:hypothetical protein
VSQPAPRTYYEHQLPAADEPLVLERVRAWVAERRPQQRPSHALLALAVAFPVGLVSWAEANILVGFSIPWLFAAAMALGLGFLIGRPVRNAGHLYDRRWAVITGAVAVLVATLGDLVSMLVLATEREEAVDRVAALGALFSSEGPGLVTEFFAHRQPIDWVVAGLGALGAAFGARPEVTEDHVRLQARIDLLHAREAEAAIDDATREQVDDDGAEPAEPGWPDGQRTSK